MIKSFICLLLGHIDWKYQGPHGFKTRTDTCQRCGAR